MKRVVIAGMSDHGLGCRSTYIGEYNGSYSRPAFFGLLYDWTIFTDGQTDSAAILQRNQIHLNILRPDWLHS
jgi:hypothetical protein